MNDKTEFIEGLVFYYSGLWGEGVEVFKNLLDQGFGEAEVWQYLIMSYDALGEEESALAYAYQWLEVAPNQALPHYYLGLILDKFGYIEQAIAGFNNAILIDEENLEFYQALANSLLRVGRFDEARAICHRALNLESNANTYLILGNIYLGLQDLDSAIDAYDLGWQISPQHPEILNNLGRAWQAQGDDITASFYLGYCAFWQQDYFTALAYFSLGQSCPQGEISFYLDFAKCYEKLGQIAEATTVLLDGLKIYPQAEALYFALILLLQHSGELEQALEIAAQGLKVMPDSILLRVESIRLLPVIYQSVEEIKHYRHRFTEELGQFIKETEITEATALALSYNTNFYLQYQGENDLFLQQEYGKLMCRAMEKKYPQWSRKRPPNLIKRKLRIGYISACFQWHTVGIVFLGWLQNCHRQDFEIFGYSLTSGEDKFNQLYRLYCDSYYENSHNLADVCEQIISDNVDILVFLDIGMYAPMTQLAALRLAPIQCAAWGHPITTGLPTIDYFISAQLLEPVGAENHYSETLICLPAIGIYYQQPKIYSAGFCREEFGLSADKVVYVSCQSLFKYLPQYDKIFAQIARAVPQSQFVFVGHENVALTDKFRSRLAAAFAKYGLNLDDFVVILSRLTKPAYWDLLLSADLFLDSFEFSGFLTTLEAISCDLPVITCRGKFMRGCQSAGILQRIAITETIANNPQEYLSMAVNLGSNQTERAAIRGKIKQQKYRLYEDTNCVQALEDFYRQVCLY